MDIGIKKLFGNKLIIASVLAIVLVVASIFYFIPKSPEQDQPAETAEELSPKKSPAQIFADLLSRQKTARFRAVYDTRLESSSGGKEDLAKRMIIAVQQSGEKQRSDIWFNTAKAVSVIRNSDGAFSCYWAENYKNPPCYKMSPGGALVESLQGLFEGQAERLQSLAEKGLLEISMREKIVSPGWQDRTCTDFSYSLKSKNISAGDMRALYPAIADVSDEDIAAALNQLGSIQNSARVCLDSKSGAPLEIDISFVADGRTQRSVQTAVSFDGDPVFNEQIELEPLKRFDDSLSDYAFGGMIVYDNTLYVSARGIMRIRDGAVVDIKTGLGSINDFIIYNNELYAAAGNGIFKLKKDGEWEKMQKNKSTFGDTFNSFKEVGGKLYAEGSMTYVFRLEGDTWVDLRKSLDGLIGALYDHNDQLYVRTRLNGIYRLDNDEWLPFIKSTKESDFGNASNLKLKTYHGQLYGQSGSDIYRIDNGNPVQISSYKDYGTVNIFFEYQDGVLAGSDQGLFMVKDSGITQEATAKQVGEVRAIAMFVGNLYIGTSKGVFIKEGADWRQLSWPDDFGPVNGFYEFDHILYAAGALGVGKLAGNEWVTTPIDFEDEKQNASIQSMIEFNGVLYAISQDEDDSTFYKVKSGSGGKDPFNLSEGSTVIDVSAIK